MTIKTVFFDPNERVWILVEGLLESCNMEAVQDEPMTLYGETTARHGSVTFEFDLHFSSKGYTVVTEKWVQDHYPTQYNDELNNRKELE